MTIDANKSRKLTEEEDFLNRWSRRKHESRQDQAFNESPIEVWPAKIEDAALPTDADMPPLESLTENSDFRGFLSPKVSEALRQQALRKLFHSPGFNVRDGLDDYDDDFTQFAKLGDIITADMKHQLEIEAKRLQQLVENETTVSQTHIEQSSPEVNDATQLVSNAHDCDCSDDVEDEQS